MDAAAEADVEGRNALVGGVALDRAVADLELGGGGDGAAVAADAVGATGAVAEHRGALEPHAADGMDAAAAVRTPGVAVGDDAGIEVAHAFGQDRAAVLRVTLLQPQPVEARVDAGLDAEDPALLAGVDHRRPQRIGAGDDHVPLDDDL